LVKLAWLQWLTISLVALGFIAGCAIGKSPAVYGKDAVHTGCGRGCAADR
jgi:hypothetical protein